MSTVEIPVGDVPGVFRRVHMETALCSTIGCTSTYEYEYAWDRVDENPPEGWSSHRGNASWQGSRIENRLCPTCTVEAIKAHVQASYSRLDNGRRALENALSEGGVDGPENHWLRDHLSGTTYPFYVRLRVETYDPEAVAQAWVEYDSHFWEYEHAVCESGECDCDDECPRVPAKDARPLSDRLVTIAKALVIRERHLSEVGHA